MEVRFHRKFYKLYERLPAKIQTRFEERLVIFQREPLHPTLRNHSLSGQWIDRRSISITGDYRAIYKEVDEKTALFEAIGTHSQLYG